MISKCLVLVAFAVFGASAQSIFNSNTQSSGCNVGKESFSSSIPITHVRTSIFENPSVQIPAYSIPSIAAESCHCMKTIVKPQLRKEIISVPTVDRIVQTVYTPHIETIECGERSVQPSRSVSIERSENVQNNGMNGQTGSSNNNNGQNSGSLIGGNFGSNGNSGGSSFGGQTGSVSGGNQAGCIFGSSASHFPSETTSGFFGGNSGSLLGGQNTESSSFNGNSNKESESLTALFENYFKNQNVCSQHF